MTINSLMPHIACGVAKKLPFAGYSVVRSLNSASLITRRYRIVRDDSPRAYAGRNGEYTIDSVHVGGETPDREFPGGHRGRVTPVPIPNTEVKPATADGTACAGVWESRSLPGLVL